MVSGTADEADGAGEAMTDFFDWLTATDYGLAAEQLADAYNLSQKELRDTAQALAPAFAMALGRTMGDSGKSADLASKFAPYFVAMPDATRKSAAEDGAADLTRNLFGSKALTDAISRQVSSVTGTAPDTVELLMRNLTLMTMQTTMQMAAANMARQQPKGLAEGDYPAAMAEMMRRGANAMEALGRPSDAPSRLPTSGLPEPMAAMMRGAFPWAEAFSPGEAASTATRSPSRPTERGAEPQASPVPNFPFLAMLEGFAKGLSDDDRREAASSPEAAPHRTKQAPAGNDNGDRAEGPEPITGSGLESLVRAGADMQDDYLKRMAALFDAHPPLRTDAAT